MTEITPTAPSPGTPERKRTGCRTALIVVGILVLILFIGLAFICFNAQKIGTFAVEKGIDALEREMLVALPEGINADDVKNTFGELKTAVKEGRVRGEAAMTKIREATRTVQLALADKKFSKEEVEDILRIVKSITETAK